MSKGTDMLLSYVAYGASDFVVFSGRELKGLATACGKSGNFVLCKDGLYCFSGDNSRAAKIRTYDLHSITYADFTKKEEVSVNLYDAFHDLEKPLGKAGLAPFTKLKVNDVVRIYSSGAVTVNDEPNDDMFFMPDVADSYHSEAKIKATEYLLTEAPLLGREHFTAVKNVFDFTSGVLDAFKIDESALVDIKVIDICNKKDYQEGNEVSEDAKTPALNLEVDSYGILAIPGKPRYGLKINILASGCRGTYYTDLN